MIKKIGVIVFAIGVFGAIGGIMGYSDMWNLSFGLPLGYLMIKGG
jgi:hypothetical protein